MPNNDRGFGMILDLKVGDKVQYFRNDHKVFTVTEIGEEAS